MKIRLARSETGAYNTRPGFIFGRGGSEIRGRCCAIADKNEEFVANFGSGGLRFPNASRGRVSHRCVETRGHRTNNTSSVVSKTPMGRLMIAFSIITFRVENSDFIVNIKLEKILNYEKKKNTSGS